MAIVENNIVKMEWQKDGWLQTKASGRSKGVFIYASQVYPSTVKGEVTVFFNADMAWIWASDAHTEEEDLWNAKELKSWVKSNLDGSFPDMYDECVEVISSGEDECIMDVLEEYGIVDAKEDIEKRVQDVRPFGYETTIGEMSGN